MNTGNSLEEVTIGVHIYDINKRAVVHQAEKVKIKIHEFILDFFFI